MDIFVTHRSRLEKVFCLNTTTGVFVCPVIDDEYYDGIGTVMNHD